MTWWSDILKKVLEPIYTWKWKEGKIDDGKVVLTAPENMHPVIVKRLNAILAEAKEAGLDVMLFEGYRSYQKQRALFNKGGVTKARPGYSWHNFGFAFDIVFVVNGKPSWADHHDWKKLGAIGKKHHMAWGGDFKKLKDMVHFEPADSFLNLTECRALYSKGGLTGVWLKQHFKNGERL